MLFVSRLWKKIRFNRHKQSQTNRQVTRKEGVCLCTESRGTSENDGSPTAFTLISDQRHLQHPQRMNGVLEGRDVGALLEGERKRLLEAGGGRTSYTETRLSLVTHGEC